MWGCHFGLRTVPAPQFDALQGRARLLSAADSLFTSAGTFGPCDAWLMPQTVLQAQKLEQEAAAALASEGADLKGLLEGIAKRSVELDSLTGLDDVERAGASAAAVAVPVCPRQLFWIKLTPFAMQKRSGCSPPSIPWSRSSRQPSKRACDARVISATFHRRAPAVAEGLCCCHVTAWGMCGCFRWMSNKPFGFTSVILTARP